MVTLLLHTTRVRSQILGKVSGVAALVTNKQRSTTTVCRQTAKIIDSLSSHHLVDELVGAKLTIFKTAFLVFGVKVL